MMSTSVRRRADCVPRCEEGVSLSGRITGDLNSLLCAFSVFSKSSAGNMCYISNQKSHHGIVCMCFKENKGSKYHKIQ